MTLDCGQNDLERQSVVPGSAENRMEGDRKGLRLFPQRLGRPTQSRCWKALFTRRRLRRAQKKAGFTMSLSGGMFRSIRSGTFGRGDNTKLFGSRNAVAEVLNGCSRIMRTIRRISLIFEEIAKGTDMSTVLISSRMTRSTKAGAINIPDRTLSRQKYPDTTGSAQDLETRRD